MQERGTAADKREAASRSEEPIPPTDLIAFVLGTGDPPEEFKRAGREYFGFFTELCGLQPDEHVLEVGSGVGRKALPLTHYLSEDGSYDGIDIVPEGVAWCTENITSRFPNFRFQVADIYNTRYNRDGKLKAEDYVFPFPDGQFDFVFLASVFTHMLPEGMDNYLSEIKRVTKPGGRSLITYFLFDDEALGLMERGESNLEFPYEHGDYRVHVEEDPEGTIAYREEFVRELYEKHGLAIREPIHHGMWSGRADFLSWQDVVVADRV
jgi:SAM-dependent methyltransferase